MANLDATVRGEGRRSPWAAVPGAAVEAVEARLAATVVAANDRRGGFSPGPTAVLTLRDGRCVFAKAADRIVTEKSADIHRREAVIASWLPPGIPTPAFLGCVEAADWVVVLFEAIDGRPPSLPWRDPELELVLALGHSLAGIPVPDPGPVAPATEVIGSLFGGWAAAEASGPAGLDPWSRRHLDLLAAWDERAGPACAGPALLHGDLRADNLLLARDGVLWVVDWPHAAIGAPWLDLAFAAPSIAMQGGPPPADLMRRSPLLASAPEDDLTAVVVGMAGYFTTRALAPPPPGLPTLRRFQALQGAAARRWAAERLGLAQP